MSKKLIIILAFFLAFLFAFVLKNTVIKSSLYFNEAFINFKNFLTESIDKHFNQAEKISLLKKENKKLKKEVNKLNAILLSCENLKFFKIINKPDLIFTTTVSYAAIPDFSKIYIDYGKKIDKPKGLVYNNFVAGIAVKNIGKFSLALLNSNEKTRYAVFIGKNEIPGIFYGKIDTIKYIPKFKDIKVGDEVITSGLDGIFYKGAKVGIITEVIEKKLYKEAKVKLFYNDLHPTYFYLIQGGNYGNRKHSKKNGDSN